MDYLINYEDDGKEVKEYAIKLYKTPTRTIKSISKYFSPCISWSKVSSGNVAFRFYPRGFIFDVAGCCIFYETEKMMLYDLGFLNSNISKCILAAISPTLNYEAGHIASLPMIRPNDTMGKVIDVVTQNVKVAKTDWDVFETSWDFQQHPMVRAHYENVGYMKRGLLKGRNPDLIKDCYIQWATDCNLRFEKLKSNEEELNRIFIDIYGLQDELTPEVEDKDVTIRRADLGRDIRSLLSYAVGCMFGRYSLDQEGLILAGQPFSEKYVYASVPVAGTGHTGANDGMTRQGDCYLRMGDEIKKCSFAPDPDNCIPITDEAYFEDDIVGRLEEFLRVVYGRETLEQNLDFIASALGNRGSTSREIIRNYFLNDFYKDHLKTYQKRPIYWLFDSGRQNGFKALVYMHRWNADTAGNVRADYLHRMQRVYEREIERMKNAADNSPDSREAARAAKRAEKLTKQLREAREYDARLAHAALTRPTIDLDDGVKVNYAKVQQGPDGESLEILAKIN